MTYLSATDSGTDKEITARKARLGGVAQIGTSKYPRLVYAVAVRFDRTLDLSALRLLPPAVAIVTACLSIEVTASINLAKLLEMEGIQALIFPSVIQGVMTTWSFICNCAAAHCPAK